MRIYKYSCANVNVLIFTVMFDLCLSDFGLIWLIWLGLACSFFGLACSFLGG